MQRTRLSTLLDTTGNRFAQLTDNPWRRISLGVISLFFGFFIGAAISTVAGQKGILDIVGAAILVLLSEVISHLFYRRPSVRGMQRPLWIELLNIFKIGIIYSLFLEAFKLGS